MVIIAYEGKTDKEFLNSLLSTYQLPQNEVTYFNFKGKDNILNGAHSYYNEIEKKYIDKINKILIVVDADNEKDPNPNRGYEASEEALKNLIKDLDFNIDIEYHIMCDCNKEGNLESFLLSVLDDTQQECIKTFKECYKYELTDKWAYNTFYKQKKHPFDFSHENFNELKKKLQNLFN
ncbi:DUF3226 domain-containing protein [Sulfurimonas sp.]|uniref:DUF3226 domain-containing protein n=1 Tax=Sulfurimonas sp. TaxID=2022749 RepID=UPI002AB2A2F9|nr:DUF3226 domain-containing protein [Sulfurimonas sp.]